MIRWIGRFLQSRFAAAALAGGLLTCAFPNLNLAGAAWVGPGIIFFLALGQPIKRSFWLGWTAGFAHFASSLYWLLFIPFPGGAIIGWLALSAYCAFFIAGWVWLSCRLFSLLTGANSEHTSWKTLREMQWPTRAAWAIGAAFLWVAVEMIRARFLSGFPWNFLGATQYRVTPLIQIASLTGVYGLSFLCVWFSISLTSALAFLPSSPGHRLSPFLEISLPLLVVTAICGWGAERMTKIAPPGRTLKAALVQPSIRQEMIFNPAEDGTRFARLMELSRRALEDETDLLLWPEASMPAPDQENFAAITNLIALRKVSMIFGADDFQVTPTSTNAYNSSFLFGPDGSYIARYHKRRLVIFGEYIPTWIPFLNRLIPIGNFTPGKEPATFRIPGADAKTSILICFEDVFPHWAREHVNAETDFLINLTNDGWFGQSAAQWQQAAMAVFRAVENGVPLVRCTNNGLTCWIDRFGRIRQIFRDDKGTVYGPGFLRIEVPLLDGRPAQLTWYQKHGDWFGWGCVILAAALLMWIFLNRPARS